MNRPIQTLTGKTMRLIARTDRKRQRAGIAAGLLLAGFLLSGLLAPLPALAQARGRPPADSQRCANPYSQRIDCSDGVIRPETTGPGGGIIIRRPGAPMPLPPMPGAPPTMQNEIRGFSR